MTFEWVKSLTGTSHISTGEDIFGWHWTLCGKKMNPKKNVEPTNKCTYCQARVDKHIKNMQAAKKAN